MSLRGDQRTNSQPLFRRVTSTNDVFNPGIKAPGGMKKRISTFCQSSSSISQVARKPAVASLPYVVVHSTKQDKIKPENFGLLYQDEGGAQENFIVPRHRRGIQLKKEGNQDVGMGYMSTAPPSSSQGMRRNIGTSQSQRSVHSTQRSATPAAGLTSLILPSSSVRCVTPNVQDAFMHYQGGKNKISENILLPMYCKNNNTDGSGNSPDRSTQRGPSSPPLRGLKGGGMFKGYSKGGKNDKMGGFTLDDEPIRETQHVNLHYCVHLTEEERETLSLEERLGRRLEFGRFVNNFRAEINKEKVGLNPQKKHEIGPHAEIGKHRCPKKVPILDFSYLDLNNPQELYDAVPRTGKKEVMSTGHSSSGKRRMTRSSSVASLFGCESSIGEPPDAAGLAAELFQKRDEDIIVIQTKDTTYAFDANKCSKSKKKTIAQLEAEELEEEEARKARTRFLASHCKCNNNEFTCLSVPLKIVLAGIIGTQLRILDLSFNKISSIEEQFTMDVNVVELDPKASTDLIRHRRHGLSPLNNAAAIIFGQLHTFYLHGNELPNVKEVLKLAPLAPSLEFLTVHGNRKIDEELAAAGGDRKRRKILDTFPHLVSLNFTTLTREDAV